MINISYKKNTTPDSIQQKTLITILQNKRVYFPYIFCKYLYPKLNAKRNGILDLCIIQHISKLKNNSFLLSSKLNNNKIDLVKKWTDRKMYKEAKIIQHNNIYYNYPSIPSYLLASNLAIKKYDFHIWLEDDTLLYDENIKNINNILGEYEIASYYNKDTTPSYYEKNFPCSSRTITRTSFDKKFINTFGKLNSWDKCTCNFNTRLEAKLNFLCNKKRLSLFTNNTLKFHNEDNYIFESNSFLKFKKFLHINNINISKEDNKMFDIDKY
jgi:hypothetical protein